MSGIGPFRSWTDEQLALAVPNARSRRQVLIALGLQPKRGNYAIIKGYIERLGIDTSHFTGKGWNKGGPGFPRSTKIPMEDILVLGSSYQSYKLRNRLFKDGLKQIECELCGWCQKAKDGRIPLELDHINGNHQDNRIENLRILCPNCHSLQSTHRGKNKNR